MRRLFQLALESDCEEIIENISWLQSSILQLEGSDEQIFNTLQLCKENNTAAIFTSCISSSNEKIVLLSLKGLATMAVLEEFRHDILVVQGEELFIKLAEIVTTRLQEYKICPLEIETALAELLTLLTVGPNDEVTISA